MSKSWWSNRWNDAYDDDYGSGYGSYGGYSSGFSWGKKNKNNNSGSRWGGYWDDGNYWQNSQDNLDEQLTVINPEGYSTPTKDEIAIKGINTGKKNRWGHSEKSYRAYTINDKAFKIIKDLSRYFYHDMMGEDMDTIWDESEEKAHDREIITKITDKIKDYTTPFVSPLEKSVYFFNKMKLTFSEKPESAEEEMKRIVRAMEQMNIDEEVLNDTKLEDTKELIVGGILGGSPFDPTTDYGGYYKPVDKETIIDRISLIKSWGDSFKISKEIAKEVTYNSDKKELMPMTSIEQIVHMDLYNILFPDFSYKLATQTLHVNLPIKEEEKKQKIIMLIDDSGSMAQANKVEWVMALLTDRCKECRIGEAELFVSKFESGYNDSRFKFHHIYDEQSFQTFIKEFRYSPSGGDTRIGDIIDYLADEINVRKKLHNLDIDLSKDKVEILVVNDGADSIKTDKFSYKTNAVSLYQTNEELKKLCMDNHGKYIVVENDKKITEYETKDIV